MKKPVYNLKVFKAILLAICGFTIFWGFLPYAISYPMRLVENNALPQWLVNNLFEKNMSKKMFAYNDILGREWIQIHTSGEDTDLGYFKIDPEYFAEGCEIKWFSHEKNLLEIYTDTQFRRIPGNGFLGHDYPRQITHEYISPETIKQGVAIGIMDYDRGSVYMRIQPAKVNEDQFHLSKYYPGGSRIWLIGFIGLCVSSFVILSLCYSKTKKYIFAFSSLIFLFWLACVLLDRPTYINKYQVDGGDDSYYLAYLQNLISDNDLFEEPIRLNFGRAIIHHLHGLPGTSVAFYPAIVFDSYFLSGKEMDRRIDIYGLRSIKVLSSLYSFLAICFLSLAFHYMRPSSWNPLFASALFWCTSLPKWSFQRNIFTHSVESALLCAILLMVVLICNSEKKHWLKCFIFVNLVGFSSLVRGELLILLLFAPLLIPFSIQKSRSFLKRFYPLYIGVSTLYVLLYNNWVNSISTGYGKITSDQTVNQSALGNLATVINIFCTNSVVLFQSYAKNGYILVIACISLIILLLVGKRFKYRSKQNISLLGILVIGLLLFVSNVMFHTPLGMEWHHRYSLKLYPLALIVLWNVMQLELPQKLRGLTLCIPVLLVVSALLNIKWYFSNGHMRDAGFWMWTDELLLSGEMTTATGLYVHSMIPLILCVGLCILLSGKRLPFSLKITALTTFLCIFVYIGVVRMYVNSRPQIAGLTATIYKGGDFGKVAYKDHIRSLPLISKGWLYGYPKMSIWKRSHSLKAKGYIYVPHDGEYQFFMESEDGAKFFINDDLLLDNWEHRTWKGSGVKTVVSLEEGFQPMHIHYRQLDKHNDGAVRLKWSGPGIPNNTILDAPYLVTKPLTILR